MHLERWAKAKVNQRKLLPEKKRRRHVPDANEPERIIEQFWIQIGLVSNGPKSRGDIRPAVGRYRLYNRCNSIPATEERLRAVIARRHRRHQRRRLVASHLARPATDNTHTQQLMPTSFYLRTTHNPHNCYFTSRFRVLNTAT